MSDQTRVSAATVIRSGKTTARPTHARPGVGNQTILSKMIRDQSAYAQERTDAPYLGNFGYLHEVSDIVSSNIEDAKNLTQLLPEIEICIQVLTALILSPKDMISTELTHAVTPNILPAKMTGEMIKVLKDYAEHDYKIKALLPDKLRKALFVDGADVTLIIPENSLDDLINGRNGKKITLENFKSAPQLKTIGQPKGFFGGKAAVDKKRNSMTLESLLSDIAADPHVTDKLDPLNLTEAAGDHKKFNFDKWKGFKMPDLYDNADMLKLEDITSSMHQAQTRTILESMGTSSYGDIEDMYHSPDLKPEDVVMITRQEDATRETIGPPLIKTGSTESCVPVCRPGRPDKPIGFLFLSDEFGGFVAKSGRSDFMRNISTGVFNNRNAVSGMLNQAAGQLDTEDGFGNGVLAQQAAQAFRDMAIRDIESRFSAGAVGNVTVSRQELAYDLMFERALAGKQTRIVYVPADMVVYWAYRFNDNGTGRSLLEDNKILSSIRALTLFMNVETMVRNSIDHRTLNITVDEDDPNKSRTKEMILHEYARQRNNAIPWATSNPRRMIETAQSSGLAVNVEGGDNYPNTKVSVDTRDIQYREINLDMDEDLRKRQTMGFGLAPEIVDLSNQIEFSSKMATSNELSLKRAIVLQEATNKFIRETIIKISISHKGIMDKLREIVGKYASELPNAAQKGEMFYIQTFFAIYSVKLPRPDTGLANRMTEMGEYSDAVQKVLDETLPDDMMTANVTGEKANEWVAVVKASVKSTLMLRYCRANNIMPELTDLLKNDTDEDPGTILATEGMDTAERFTKIIQAVGLKLYAKALLTENQMTTLMERMDTERVEGTEAGEGQSTDGGGGGGSDDYSSDDDFDFGDSDGEGDGGDFDFGDDTSDDSSEDGGSGDGGDASSSEGGESSEAGGDEGTL